MATLLIVDDVESYLRALATALKADFEVRTATSLGQAKDEAAGPLNLALVDIRLSEEDESNRDGLLFLDWMRKNRPDVPVLMMSAYRDFEIAVDALNLGAVHFLRKPIHLRELRPLLHSFVDSSAVPSMGIGSQPNATRD